MKHLKTIFLILCLGLITFNVFELTRTLIPNRPVIFLGFKFSGLDDILKNETHIGYITDYDLKQTAPLAEYEQAQYTLAPVTLDINNPDHRFFIINCSSDAMAAKKLQELGAQPIRRNNFGIILAFRPPNV